MFLGLTINKRPIPTDPIVFRRNGVYQEFKSPKRGKNPFQLIPAAEDGSVPHWVQVSVREQFSKASYSDLLKGYQAIKRGDWE